MANKPRYVELGLACADICRAFGKEMDELSPAMVEAIQQLITWVELGTHTLGDPLTVRTHLVIPAFWSRFRGTSP